MNEETSNNFLGKIIVFTAPSGAGKTTIVRHILHSFESVAFSVSATTRKPRDYEKNGTHYYFLSDKEFHKKIDDDAFVEYEEVYPGLFYGTLKKELQRLWSEGKHVIFDIDVHGAIEIKEIYGNRALTIFIEPPSIQVLQERLRQRGTEDEVSIQKRIAKFSKEMEFLDKFDYRLINDDLEIAFQEAEKIVMKFINDTL